MAKSSWRGSGGSRASDGRIDLAPRRQRRLERKRANDKRHLNHPKLGNTWSTSSLQPCLPSASEKYLQQDWHPPIAEKTKRCKCSSVDVLNSFLILPALLHFLGPIDLRQRAVAVGTCMGVKDPNIKICTFMPAGSPDTTSLDIHPGVFSAVCRRRELLTFKRFQGRLEADVNTSIFHYFPKQVPYLVVPKSQVPSMRAG